MLAGAGRCARNLQSASESKVRLHESGIRRDAGRDRVHPVDRVHRTAAGRERRNGCSGTAGGTDRETAGKTAGAVEAGRNLRRGLQGIISCGNL